MLQNLLKKSKFSIAILIVAVILNIIFLCQPVVGTYSGVTKYGSSYYTSSFNTKLEFKRGYVYGSNSQNGETENYVGLYQRVKSKNDDNKTVDKIVLISFPTNSYSSSVSTYKDTFIRRSVFTLSKGDNTYTSATAVFLQIFFCCLEITFLIRFISQYKSEKASVKSDADNELDYGEHNL
ncbi:MAG: hypothetical protein II984_10885 [Clostridia bacterium]|nr:hypothetical protein [Clostridia bacterium]